MNDIAVVMKALEYAAGRHRKQFRKGEDMTPYINHPIGVASLLANVAGENDPVLLSAAILHDVIEDTPATYAQVRHEFGSQVADGVQALRHCFLNG